MALKVDEARLLAVYRAIKELDRPTEISVADVGAALAALEGSYDLEKEERALSAKELGLLIRGFVGGLGAANPAPVSYDFNSFDPDEVTQFQGGHTGGTAVGQGEDNRYVASSADYGKSEEGE